MRQGTTPTYIVTVDGYDLTDKTVYVTLRDMRRQMITKTGEQLTIAYDGSDSTIAFRLSQEETFGLFVGRIEVQVRFVDAEGVAYATEIAKVENLNVLLKDVITYGGE